MATLLTGLRDIAATVQIGYNAILGCPLDPVGRGDGFRALTAEFYTPLDQPVLIYQDATAAFCFPAAQAFVGRKNPVKMNLPPPGTARNRLSTALEHTLLTAIPGTRLHGG